MVPMVEVATTLPVLSVARMALVSDGIQVLPLRVRLVVDAPPLRKVTPVKVLLACAMRPDWKVLSPVQMLVPPSERLLLVRQTPLTEKQPVEMFTPLPKVEVPVPETLRMPPMVVDPVLETAKKVVVADGVEDEIKKR